MKFSEASCSTCYKKVEYCRNKCSSLQPMITLLLQCKEDSTSGMERSVIDDIVKVLSILELNTMDKAIKEVKKIYE